MAMTCILSGPNPRVAVAGLSVAGDGIPVRAQPQCGTPVAELHLECNLASPRRRSIYPIHGKPATLNQPSSQPPPPPPRPELLRYPPPPYRPDSLTPPLQKPPHNAKGGSSTWPRLETSSGRPRSPGPRIQLHSL